MNKAPVLVALFTVAACGKASHSVPLAPHGSVTPRDTAPVQSGDADWGFVGKDGLFHPGPRLKKQLAAEDAKVTIAEPKAARLCEQALERRTGRKPNLSLADSFPDGGRFYVDGEPGSKSSETTCFIEKDGVISKIRR